MEVMADYLANPWLQRAVFVLGGVLLGLLVERVVVDRIRRMAARTQFKWDDIISDSLAGVPTVWLGAGGVYLALNVDGADPLLASTVMKGLTVIVIGSIVIAGMRAVGGAVELLSSRAPGAVKSTTLVVSLSRLAVGILGMFIILQNLGIDISPLVTALGIGGLAVALALQDTLGNLFAGIQIILSKQVRPRDYIKLSSGEEGWVTDVKGRNTTIQTFPDGNLVVVPNSVLSSSIVKNYTMPRKALWVSVPVGVSYASDLEHVQAVALSVASEAMHDTEGGAALDEPIFRFLAFGDSSVNFEVRMMVRDFEAQGPVRHEFIKRLHRRFREEGIEIPFPIRTIVMKKET